MHAKSLHKPQQQGSSALAPSSSPACKSTLISSLQRSNSLYWHATRNFHSQRQAVIASSFLQAAKVQPCKAQVPMKAQLCKCKVAMKVLPVKALPSLKEEWSVNRRAAQRYHSAADEKECLM